ncbi:nicotianamine synthase family protein [Paenibacillus sp. PL2-23]|uniref:nicotianamine synthase family protein n=1 Tax=Paenibacillus sp. PL2-23 TaxID=2100729 RepID=UPI0030FCB78F
MIVLNHLKQELMEYADRFDALSLTYDQSQEYGSKLESLLNEFSLFVTNDGNKAAWNRLSPSELESLESDMQRIRGASASCVAMMEKHRALRLREGHSSIADYFRNIETCIDTEFGGFSVTPHSKVLLVGSGSFPMTPLLIARRTGAEVVGIDIDEEAIQLGQEVVDRLGGGLPIRLEHGSVEHLAYTGEATHIIFSSTVGLKYELLDRLHALTMEHVVVAMRYGNGLKSLFNYPMQEVDHRKWRLSDRILRQDQVFDVALYTKSGQQPGEEQ